MNELIKYTPNDVELGKKVRTIIVKKAPLEIKGINITYNGVPISEKELEVLTFNKLK